MMVGVQPPAAPWLKHVVRVGKHCAEMEDVPDPEDHRKHVEPWLSALFQAEHLNLLVGSGFTTGVAIAANVPTVDMSPEKFELTFSEAVHEVAKESALR